MIVQTHVHIGKRDFIYTISDSNRYVIRDDINYIEAWDPSEYNRQYSEGDIITDS